jgi:hypothetical protein
LGADIPAGCKMADERAFFCHHKKPLLFIALAHFSLHKFLS